MQPLKSASSIMPGAAARLDFPLLAGDLKLVYLDSAATAQKSRAVLDAMERFATHDYGSVNRGIYPLAARATQAYANARSRVAQFLNAARDEEVVFTKGATEAINLVAVCWGRANLKKNDEIILTALEHHANIVPWVRLAQEIGFTIKVAPIAADGSVTLETIAALVTDKTKLIACAHVSNVLGTVLPVAEICAQAKARGIVTLIDGCQAVAHRAVDVQALDCDFYVCSAHKLYGPTGIGALYGRYELLEVMPPYNSGGDMIEYVSFTNVSFKPPPYRFEAGTPPVIEAVGFATACDYIENIGFGAITAQETRLLDLATAELQKIDGLTIHGAVAGKEAIICFSIAGMQPYDMATLLGEWGICVRAGQHCAEPLHDALGVNATLRISFALYNTEADVVALINGIKRAQAMLT